MDALNNLDTQAGSGELETQVLNDKFNSLLGRNATQEEINALSESDKQEIEARYAAQEQFRKQEAIDNAYREELESQQHSVFRDLNPMDGSFENIQHTSAGFDEDYAYRRAKQTTHDYAYLSSWEHGVKDIAARNKAIEEDSVSLTPEEARALGEEYGVEVKYDKNVARGEVMHTINHNLYKQALEYDLAMYRNGASYSTAQNIAMLGSALSGGVGFYETALTVGLGWLLPQTIVGTVGRALGAVKKGSDIAKGIDMAYKSQRAIKEARKYKNTLKILEGAQDAASLEKASETLGLLTKNANAQAELAAVVSKASDATQRSYKLARLGLFVPGAEQEISLGAKTALSIADAELSSVIPMAVSGYSSQRNQDQLYTAKDVAIEALFAGLIGGVIPVGVAGASKVFGAGADAFQSIKAHVTKKIDEHAYKKAMEGVSDAELDASAKATQQAVDNIVSHSKKPSPEFIEKGMAAKDLPISDKEFYMNVGCLLQKADQGELARLSDLPFKTFILTHLPSKVVDDITKGLGNISDATRKLMNFTKLKASKHGLSEIQFSGETGILNRKAVKGHCKSELEDVLVDIYNANLNGDIDAFTRVEEYVNHQKRIYDKISDVKQRANDLLEKNLNKEKDSVSLDYQEKFKYAIADILGELYYGRAYSTILDWTNKGNFEELSNKYLEHQGLREANKQATAIREEMLKKALGYLKEKRLDGGRKVLNVNHKKLQELQDEMSKAADDILELLDSDNILAHKYNSAEDMIEAINKHTHYDDTDLHSILGAPRVTTDEYKAKIADINNERDIVDARRAELQSYTDDAKLTKEVTQAMAEVDASRRSANAGARDGDTYFTVAARRAEEIDTFLDTGLAEMRTNIQQALDTEDFQKVVHKIAGKGDKVLKREILRDNDTLIRKLVTENVAEPLSKLGVALSDSDIVDLVERFLKTFEEGNAKSLTVRADEKIVDQSIPAEHQLEQAKLGLEREKLVNSLIDPMLLEVERLAINKQGHYLKHVSAFYGLAKSMMDNPYIPGESITSLFTFSPYNLKNSNLNVEYRLRNSSVYFKDLENRLAKKSAGTTDTEKLIGTQGTDLVSYLRNEDNKNGILTAYTYIKMYGSADSSKKAGVHFNANDAIIAQEILDQEATLLNSLHNAGSMKSSIGLPFKMSKLKQASAFIPQEEVQDIARQFGKPMWLPSVNSRQMFVYGKEKIKAVDFIKHVKNGMAQLDTIYNKLHDVDDDKAMTALFAFKHFDLDKMFNGRGYHTFSLNKARDLVMSGGLEPLAKQDIGEFKKAIEALEIAADRLVGRSSDTGKSFMAGWINDVIHRTGSASDTNLGLSNRYVSDLGESVRFKDVDSELTAIKYLGFDSIKEMCDRKFDLGQRALAILQVTGAEPLRVVDDAIAFWKQYRHRHQHDVFKDKVKWDSSELSKGAIRSIKANAEMAAGVDQVPAKAPTRFFKALSDLLSAPLLVNAGVRSMTDYSYQSQWMITNGLAESSDLFGWSRGVGNAIRLLRGDKELQRVVGYNQFVTQDSLLRMITNTDTDSLGGTLKSPDALARFEDLAKNISNFMINGIGRVGQATNLNRSAAALTIMRAISSQAGKEWKHLPNEAMRNMLTRHGITERDWNFLRKHCNIEFDDYLTKQGLPQGTVEKDYGMFIPDNLLDLSDDVFAKEMTGRKHLDPKNKVMLENFKDEMYMKASILINSSADEMTTLPTYRTQTAMSLGRNRNEGIGAAMNVVFKYRSFGLACTQIHFGRRVAQMLDTTDARNVQTIFNKAFCLWQDPKSIGPITQSVGGLIISTAFAQMIMNEVIDAARGRHQGWFDQQGKFNTSKLVDPIIDSTGAFEPLLDGTIGKWVQGNMTTNGLTMQIAPPISNAYRDATRILKPLLSEDAQGERGKRFAAAAAGTLAKNLSVSEWVGTSLIYNNMVGSWLEEQEKGAQAYRRMVKGKRRQGYSVDEWYSRYKYDPTVFGQ